MRRTALEVECIKQAARRHFGKEARVWLFGSRANDTQRGGDIDLYVETRMTDSRRIFQAEINFLADVKTRIGDQKIDLVIDSPRRARQPIHRLAKETGLPL